MEDLRTAYQNPNLPDEQRDEAWKEYVDRLDPKAIEVVTPMREASRKSQLAKGESGVKFSMVHGL